MNAGQALGQQAIARHGEDDAGLPVGHHQDHRGHAEDGTQVDEAGEPVFVGALQRQGYRVVHAEELTVGNDPRHDHGDRDVENGAGRQRTDDADGQVAVRAFDLFGRRRYGVESDEGEEHQGRCAEDAAVAVGCERLPVGRLHMVGAHHDEQQDHGNLDRHHQVVDPRRFANAERQHGGQADHDQQRRQVDPGLDAGNRARGRREFNRQGNPEAAQQ
ncbi:hypothetical protein D3C78_1355510 [compost metagenome]